MLKHAVAPCICNFSGIPRLRNSVLLFVRQFSNTPEASNITLASDLNFNLEMATDGKIQVMDYSLMEYPRFGIHVDLPRIQGKFQC